uniref:GHKL domain-containing protein n=1 Tax=Butyricimonas faecalis TaxID=2093856 RepID=UPI003FEFBE61
SIFGNALDNAIEHVIMIPEVEKRLIHLTVSAKKSFVFIKIENYCEDKIQKNENEINSFVSLGLGFIKYGCASFKRRTT